MQFAIMVSTVIALLLLFFLTLTHFHSVFKTQHTFFLLSIDETNRSIIETGKNITSEKVNQPLPIHTLVHKNNWGAFEMVESTTVFKNSSYSKKAMLGTKPEQPFSGLYLSDTRLPLVLTGNSKIEGIVYVSDRGIKSGSISGNHFTGTMPAPGEIKSSTGKLPHYDPLWKSYHKQMLEYIPIHSDIVESPGVEIINSFFEETTYVYMREKLVISEKYTGYIILKSETEIVISKHANLTDVLVVAPKITIESGFKGNAYFLASDQIIVEDQVYLDYPSSLILYDDKTIEESNTPPHIIPIQISENTQVKGVVIYLTDKAQEYHTKTNLSIEPTAIIKGEIYCEGNIELYGTVKGTVYAHRFVTNKFGSVYINHLFDGKILGNYLSEKYCGIPFENSKNKVVKWLY